MIGIPDLPQYSFEPVDSGQEAVQTGPKEDGAKRTEESRDIFGTVAEPLFGKITAIDGSTITLAEQPGKPDGREPSDKQNSDGNAPVDNQNPDGNAPEDNQNPDGNTPADNQNPDGSTSAGNKKPAEILTEGGNVESGILSELPEDGNRSADVPRNLPESGGQPSVELTLTGETRELTVTEETIITIKNTSATLSELSMDDVITAFMEGNNLNSLTVGDFGAGGRDKGPGVPGGEKPASESSNVEADVT